MKFLYLYLYLYLYIYFYFFIHFLGDGVFYLFMIRSFMSSNAIL